MKIFSRFLTFLFLLFSLVVFSFTYEGLWAETGYTKSLGRQGPGLVVKNGGNILFLSKFGELFEITPTGGVTSRGQASGIVNVVAPPAYMEFGSNNNYIVYVTAQAQTQQNKFVIHKVEANQAVTENIDNASMGLVAYADKMNNRVYVFFGTLSGKLYKLVYDVSGATPSKVDADSETINLGAPIKIPPILTPDKSKLYVITSNGKFYEINTGTFNLPTSEKLFLSGEFAVPMAMDESGFVYALSANGVFYKIDPSGNEEHVKYLNSANSSGPLIDGEGFIYLFGDNGKVVVLNNGLTKVADYTVGQNITTTPAVLKENAGLTYLIVPSTSNEYSGKITILSFDSVLNKIDKVTDFSVNRSFPISAAVGVAPLGALQGDNYVFVTADNNGTVYAWKTNAKGPYGIWGMYGSNAYRTNFIDSASMQFKTKIWVKAVEGLYGRPLSNSVLGGSGNYGLLYDARLLNADNSVAATYKNYRTNVTDPANVVEGIPGAQKLEVKFSTPTDLAVLLRGSFKDSVVKGGTPPSTDSRFKFRFWNKSGNEAYEGSSESDNPAILTYRFNDRVVKVYTDAWYRYYIYHKYPLPGALSASTESAIGYYDYNTYRNNPSQAKITINSKPNQGGKKFYAYRWEIYAWNPDLPGGYKKETVYDKDSVSLELSGPHYIEIYYAELSATVTLLLPEFAYGNVKGYLFLDAAQNGVAHMLELKTKNGVKIVEATLSGQNNPAPNVSIVNELSYKRDNELKYVFSNYSLPLSTDTRIATVTLNLFFPEKTRLYGNDDSIFRNYFELGGYSQIQGQLVDTDNLKAKSVYRNNKFLYIPGDFDGDYDVDANDWILFSPYLGQEVSGDNLSYNIGPRDGFVPPYPSLNSFSAGFLKDTTNKVDEQDFFIFVSTFGISVPESERVK